MNIFSDIQESLPLMHPDFRKSLLPNRRAEPQFASCPKRKTALDQLNRLFHGGLCIYGGQHMEVVGR